MRWFVSFAWSEGPRFGGLKTQDFLAHVPIPISSLAQEQHPGRGRLGGGPVHGPQLAGGARGAPEPQRHLRARRAP